MLNSLNSASLMYGEHILQLELYRPEEQVLKRFIFLFTVGALTLAGAQTALVSGIHPAHRASLRVIVQSSAALILGTSLAVTGLLGLAEGYQKTARWLGQLLDRKEVADEARQSVATPADLEAQSQEFWKAYRGSGLALCFFVAGLLALSVALVDASFLVYISGLIAGAVALGVLGLFWMGRSLRAARQAQRQVECAAAILETQPERPEEEPAAPEPEPEPRRVVRGISRERWARILERRKERREKVRS